MVRSFSLVSQPLQVPSFAGRTAAVAHPKACDPQDDEAKFLRWASHMSTGNYADAWRTNEENGKHWPSAHQLWDEEDLSGRHVCLHALHGLGDVVQMARFLPVLQQRCRSVSCFVPHELVPLMKYFDGTFEAWSHADRPQHQDRSAAHAEFMELPHIFKLQSKELPVRCNYLRLPGDSIKRMAFHMGCGIKPRIGLVWRGGAWDPERWIQFQSLEPLFRCDQFEWWSMQASDAALDVQGAGVRRFDQLVAPQGLPGFAAALCNLDLLITTDTLAAHVAGAMGLRTWVLLKQNADWRWMRNTVQSPWYPSIRLFRQRTPGDWAGVIQEVRAALLGRSYADFTSGLNLEQGSREARSREVLQAGQTA